MSFFNFNSFIKLKVSDGALYNIDSLIKEFSSKTSIPYRCTNVAFDSTAKPSHIEYVFPFVNCINGIESERFYRLSLPSDGLSTRFKSMFDEKTSDTEIPDAEISYDAKTIEKSNKKFFCCKQYIDNNGIKEESDKVSLPIQNKGDALFLKQMFFVRLLSDFLKEHPDHRKALWLRTNHKNNIVDINDKNADIYLMGILFYKQEIAVTKTKENPEDYIEFLFSGKKSSRERLEDFQQISPNVAETIDETDYHQLIELILNHPLLEHYLKFGKNNDKQEEKRKDLLLLLRQCLYYRDKDESQEDDKKGFYIVPVIDNIILNKRNKVQKIVSKEQFSPLAYYKLLGKIAEKASLQNDSHYVSTETVYKIFKGEKDFEDYNKKLQRRAKREKQPDDEISNSDYGKMLIEFDWFNEFLEFDVSKQNFRFKDKILRFFFIANYLSIDYNEFALFDKLLAYCGITEKIAHSSQDNSFDFDSLALLSTMTLHLMSWTATTRFLCYLATKQANKTEIKNRYRQKSAVAIISYSGLWESHLINNEARKSLFKAAYGYTSFGFQNKRIDILLEQPFYAQILKDHCKNLKNNPAEVQPVYFYLYHNNKIVGSFADSTLGTGPFYEDSIIHKCFEYRDLTWKRDFDSIDDIHKFEQFVAEAIEKANDLFNRKDPLTDESKNAYVSIIQVYAVQALLLSISNYSRIYSIDYLIQAIKQSSVKSIKSKLLRMAVYCDYYTRKFNSSYNKLCSGELSSSEDKNKCFLLCGPFKVSSIRKYNLENKIVISESMKEDYKTWLSYETGRHKILLMRLLAYTNFYNTNSLSAKDIPDVGINDFLKYDNVDIEKIYKSKIEKAGSDDPSRSIDPLEWYKTP